MSSVAATMGIAPKPTKKQNSETLNRSLRNQQGGFAASNAAKAMVDAKEVDDLNAQLKVNPMTEMKETALGNLKTYFYNPRIKQ